MDITRTIKDGYQCAAAAVADGWLGAALVIPDIDEGFVDTFDAYGIAKLKQGKTLEDWSAAFQALRRRVVAFRSETDDAVVLSEPDRVGGLAVCGAPVSGRQNGMQATPVQCKGEFAQ